MSTTSSTDLEQILSALAGGEAQAECECHHPSDPSGRCARPARVRVTVVCAAEGCDGAAGVHLVCHECLAAWSRRARQEGVRLRINPL
jgi:hypothetical protein